ncbi:MAG: thioredoxin domain-containing protein [gamma proteobacterium symbiont of Phacoides pectinatus]
MAPQLGVLIRLLASEPDPDLAALLELTLEQMAGLGLRDHIGGGFFRYTIDPGWRVPHFEKMLYSQALLSRLYLEAAGRFRREDFRSLAAETLDFTLREFAGRGGGFISSLSAIDAEGGEGGGYLWREEQLGALLAAPERDFARRRWGLGGDAPLDGGYLPLDLEGAGVFAPALGLSAEEAAELEQRLKRRLLEGRRPRAHPRDEKQLAAWNALHLSALVAGARAFPSAPYRTAAARLREHWDGERLHRAVSRGRSLGRAGLEDYAYLARALYDWAELSGRQEDRVLARRLAQRAWALFFDARAGGWREAERPLVPGMGRQGVLRDAPMPSPAAVLIGLSRELGGELARYADRALALGQAEVLSQPLSCGTPATPRCCSAPPRRAEGRPRAGPNARPQPERMRVPCSSDRLISSGARLAGK